LADLIDFATGFIAAGLEAGFLAFVVMLMLLLGVAAFATVEAASTRTGCASPARYAATDGFD
jgi:uncharacterized membrane protein YfcA